MLHQRSPAVARLGLAEFRTGTEALHGAAWNGPATVFPQAVGFGATWDPGLVTELGVAVAREVRALHDADPMVSLNLWAPVVNLLRDPRWGRNEEGYSEDPRLTAATAIAYCRGLRGDDPAYLRTAPTLKHFLGYNNEDGRDTTSSVLRPRVLHEYELPAFRGPVEAGAACGVMPAYNLVNGRPCHVSPYLALARSWTDEELLICSDAGAPSNLVDTEHYFADHPAGHAAALRAGVDSFTDHDGDPAFTAAQLTGALARGLITMADVDRAVRRKLLIRLRLGEFDAGGGPFASDGAGMLNCTAHQRLARRAARRAIVLLKNDAATLPLRPGPGSRIAVIGPLSEMVCEDWYSGTLPYQVTAADGLREALGALGGEVTGREGIDRVAVRATSRGRAAARRVRRRRLGQRHRHPPRAADGRYLSVRDDGALAADAGAPNGWVVHETFAITRLAATSAGGARVLLRSTATGRYLGIDPDTGTLTAAAPTAAEAEPLSWDIVADGTGLAAAAARAARRRRRGGRQPSADQRQGDAGPGHAGAAARPGAAHPRRARGQPPDRRRHREQLSVRGDLGAGERARDRLDLPRRTGGGPRAGRRAARRARAVGPPAPDLVPARRGPAGHRRLRHHQVQADLPVLRRASRSTRSGTG